jgi:hypothetical protein
MHIGKCFLDSPSTMSAVISSPLAEDVADNHSDETPARKPCERLSRRGTIRVSSSNRDKCFKVTYQKTQLAKLFLWREH